MEWMNQLTERQRSEVKFAQAYVTHFDHGTDGHSRLQLIAKLADMLTQYEQSTVEEETENLPQTFYMD